MFFVLVVAAAAPDKIETKIIVSSTPKQLLLLPSLLSPWLRCYCLAAELSQRNNGRDAYVHAKKRSAIKIKDKQNRLQIRNFEFPA